MSTTKHTAGPWTFEGRGDTFAIVADNNTARLIAEIPYAGDVRYEPLDSEDGKNAHLIAAAPELLAALEGLLTVAFDLNYVSPEQAEAEAVAKTAINKAKGITA